MALSHIYFLYCRRILTNNADAREGLRRIGLLLLAMFFAANTYGSLGRFIFGWRHHVSRHGKAEILEGTRLCRLDFKWAFE